MEWITTFGKRMKILVLGNQVKTDVLCAVSLHCNNIRHLDLWEVERGGLEGLHLWKNIGNSLEILKLSFEFKSSGKEEMR